MRVRGLVHLEQGSCWNITPAVGEAFATQWRYLDRPKDAFSGRVVDFHRLARPFDVNLRARGNYHRTHGYDVNFVASGHRIVLGLQGWAPRAVDCFRYVFLYMSKLGEGVC